MGSAKAVFGAVAMGEAEKLSLDSEDTQKIAPENTVTESDAAEKLSLSLTTADCLHVPTSGCGVPRRRERCFRLGDGSNGPGNSSSGWSDGTSSIEASGRAVAAGG